MPEFCGNCGREFTSVMAAAHKARHEPACVRKSPNGEVTHGLEEGRRYRLTVQVSGKRQQVIGVVMSTKFPGQWPLYVKTDAGRDRFYVWEEVLESGEVDE